MQSSFCTLNVWNPSSYMHFSASWKNHILKEQLTITSKKETHPKATFTKLLQKLFWFFPPCGSKILWFLLFSTIHLNCYSLNSVPRHHGPHLEHLPWIIKDWTWSLSFPGVCYLLSYSYCLSSFFFLIKIFSYRYLSKTMVILLLS